MQKWHEFSALNDIFSSLVPRIGWFLIDVISLIYSSKAYLMHDKWSHACRLYCVFIHQEFLGYLLSLFFRNARILEGKHPFMNLLPPGAKFMSCGHPFICSDRYNVQWFVQLMLITLFGCKLSPQKLLWKYDGAQVSNMATSVQPILQNDCFNATVHTSRKNIYRTDMNPAVDSK